MKANHASAEEMAEMIIRLADSFGVTAHLHAVETVKWSTSWRGYSTPVHTTSLKRHLHILVRTPNGGFGRAWASEWNPSAWIRAFHRARNAVCPDPSLALACDRLQALEKRFPPLASEPTSPEEGPDLCFFREVEGFHRSAMAHSSSWLEATNGWLSREKHYAFRSDGVFHQAMLWRAGCEQHGKNSDGEQVVFRGGCSGPANANLSAPMVFAMLEQEREHSPVRIGSPQLAPYRHEGQSAVPLLLDAAILARLLYACLSIPAERLVCFQTGSLSFEPLEGTPGYNPIHPFGYLLAPAALVTKEQLDIPLLSALRLAPPSFSGHLTLNIPTRDGTGRLSAIAGKASALLQQARWTGGPFLILEGVRHFHVDPMSGEFALLPLRTWLCAQEQMRPVAPFWVIRSISAVISSLAAGLQPFCHQWASPDSHWTVSTPRFAIALDVNT